jgi:hypothetical protein
MAREKYLPSPGIKARFSGHHSHRLFTVRNEMCRLDTTDNYSEPFSYRKYDVSGNLSLGALRLATKIFFNSKGFCQT